MLASAIARGGWTRVILHHHFRGTNPLFCQPTLVSCTSPYLCLFLGGGAENMVWGTWQHFRVRLECNQLSITRNVTCKSLHSFHRGMQVLYNCMPRARIAYKHTGQLMTISYLLLFGVLFPLCLLIDRVSS